jgi:cation diffusion facilitator family transporter
LYASPALTSLDLGMAVSFVSAAINGLLGYYLVQKGHSSHSPALIADGKHLRLDAYNGILVVVALAITYLTNWFWVDSVASFLFAAFMCWQGIHLIRESVAALMDETNPALFEKVTNWVVSNKKAEWIDLHNLRVQQYGGDLHIDCHLTLPRYWDLSRTHEEIHAFEEMLGKLQETHVEIFVHADPCLDECCNHCTIADCAIRKAAFSKTIEWNKMNLALNQKHFNETLARS